MSAFTTNPKEHRVKYIRALERFLGSCAGALKNDHFDVSVFERRVEKSLKVLRKVEPVRLDSTYMSLMESYVSLVIKIVADEKMAPDEKHRILLKEANQIEKERNKSTYKKSKHSKSDFEDGY